MSTEIEDRKRWMYWLIMGLGILLIFNLSRGAIGLWKARDRMKVAETELDTLTKQKQTLELQLQEQLSEGYAEKEIRDKLGMGKPGELVVILPEDASGPGEISPAPHQNVEEQQFDLRPNWQKWLSVLGF